MDVIITGVGANSNIEAQVDPTHQASRVNLKPLEHIGSGVIGGHFYLAATFSNTAAQPATPSQIFSLRWADTRTLFVLKQVTISSAITTAFGASQLIDYDLVRATSFSTNPTGGTSITPATTAQKARSANMSGSLLATSGSIMISSGGALTAGTQTLDTQPFGYGICSVQYGTGAANTIVPPPGMQNFYDVRDFGEHPIVLAANEGFVIRTASNYGATGVVKFGVFIVWSEVPSY